jgi:hypothetical protein
MGNNAEIRRRMETYRGILLAINWICSIIGIIVGFVLLGKIGGYAAAIIIIAVILGIIGHFLINVGLAIPFILLNNGDIMEKQIKLQKQLLIHFNVSEQTIDNIIGIDIPKELTKQKMEDAFETKYLTEIENDKEKILESKYFQMEYNDLVEKLLVKFPVSIRRDIENIEKKHGIEIAKKVVIKKLLE